MQLEHKVHILIGHLGSSVRVGKSHKMSTFGESIHYHKHHRLQMGLKQSFNKVHTHIQPWLLRNGQRLQQTSRETSLMLKFLTSITLFHILLLVLPQPRPIEIFLKPMQGLEVTRMTPQRVVMHLMQHHSLQILIRVPQIQSTFVK